MTTPRGRAASDRLQSCLPEPPGARTAGFEPFRSDEDTRAGQIIIDMFQALLVADLVVADLTIENPNVWYELSARPTRKGDEPSKK
jgi:hypothetical protein